MEKFAVDTQVKVTLSENDAHKLQIKGSFDNMPCKVKGHYQNSVDGHYVEIHGQVVGIADKYNALSNT